MTAILIIAAYAVGGIVCGFLWGRDLYREGIEERFSMRARHRGNKRYALVAGVVAGILWGPAFIGFCLFAPFFALIEWVERGDKS